jgi:capsular polysaccharide biosynthesis protein
MEEIDIKEVFDFYKSKALIILIAIIVCIIGGNLYSKFLKVPKYESSTKIVLVSSNKKETTKADLSFNQDLVAEYSVVVKSDTTLRTVLDNLNLNDKYSVNELSKMISVSSVENTGVINIKVTSTDSEEAANIANSLSEVFAKVVNDIYSLDNVYILDKAEVNKKAVNDSVVKENVIYFLAGFVLSVGVLFVVFYFDDSIKNSEELEKKFNVCVIGNVPLEERGM